MFLHVYEHIYLGILSMSLYIVFIHYHKQFLYTCRLLYLTFFVAVLHTLV